MFVQVLFETRVASLCFVGVLEKNRQSMMVKQLFFERQVKLYCRQKIFITYDYF